MTNRTRSLLARQWDTLLGLAAALVLSILSTLDVVGGDPVAASTLAVLTLIGIALVKDREAREAWRESSIVLTKKVRSLERQIRTIDERMRSGIHVLAASDINAELERTAALTSFWRFKGGTGTYLRAETLPRLAERRGARREVWIEIVDPTDIDVCQRYAGYRRRLENPRSLGDREPWSLPRVRVEAYATVIAAVWFSQHRNLRIHLALTSHMSILRYDMSSFSIVMTNEESPWALKVAAETPTYDCYYDELSQSFDQARPVDVDGVSPLPRNQISDEDVGRTLEQLGLMAPCTDDARVTSPEEISRWAQMLSAIALHAISEPHANQLGFAAGGARNPYLAPVYQSRTSARRVG